MEAEVFRLKLRHTWTTTMPSSDYRDELQIRLTSGGITGHGEGAPIVRYNETAEQGKQVVESLRPMLTSADPRQFTQRIQRGLQWRPLCLLTNAFDCATV